MVKWFCSSALCFNNFKSKDSNGEALKYYRLPREENIQAAYRKVFQTSGMNWGKGHICAAHWSSGFRKGTNDLPDVAVPSDQYEKMHQKYITAEKVLLKYKKPSDKIRTQFKKAKHKYELATQQIIAPKPATRTPTNRENVIPISTRKSRAPSKKQYKKN